MTKYIVRLLLLALPLIAASCSETPAEESEFDNWQERNDTYFNTAYQTAKNNPGNYKLIRSWSLPENVGQTPESYIVAQVLHEGSGTVSPMYSDSATIHYRGRFIPSKSFAAGYVFDQTWSGDYNLSTMEPVTLCVGRMIDGFTTALMHMHPGDRWLVTIPYGLAYGTATYSTSSSSVAIPACSDLVFDITMVSFHRPGPQVPETGSN